MYKFPITIPKGPLTYDDANFDSLFVRLSVYNELDKYIFNIQDHCGTFWVSSPGGGFGKSTMLNYITRQLFIRIGELRALPFYVKLELGPSGDLEYAFIKGFLEAVAQIPNGLSLSPGLPPDIERIRREVFVKKREGIRVFLRELPKRTSGELKVLFRQCLDSLDKLLKIGRFNKYVLLIDEMDKIDPDSVLRFLGRNQHLFEKLYYKHGFVAFIAGHRPWVEQIHGTTEYSFFQGRIFRLRPIIDIRDVKRLIDSRLTIYRPYMRPEEIPFTDEAYKKIRELARGNPRQIIRLAEFILNRAYEERLPSIGSGFIDKIAVEDRLIEQMVLYLRDNYETLEKIRRATDEDVDDILYAIYDFSPSHEIPKYPYDSNADARIRHLGLELTDKDWREGLSKLLRFGCIEDVGSKYKISNDVVNFLDKISLEDYPIDKSKIVPLLVRKLMDMFPPEKHIHEPSEEVFLDAIDRAFAIHPNMWLTEDKILECFRDTTAIILYIKSKYHGRDFMEVSEKLFKKYLKRYLKKKAEHLAIWCLDGHLLYRKLPEQVSMSDFKRLCCTEDIDIVNRYIHLVIKDDYKKEDIICADYLIEKLILILGAVEGVYLDSDFLRRRRRYTVFRQIGLPDDVKRLLRAYLDLTKSEEFSTRLIKPLIQNITLKICDLICQKRSYQALQRPSLGRFEDPYARKVRDSLRKAEKFLAEDPNETVKAAFSAVIFALQRKVIEVRGFQVLEELRRTRRIFLAPLLDILEKAGVIIDENVKKDLAILRDLRNKVVHDVVTASEEDAKWALNVARKVASYIIPNVVR